MTRIRKRDVADVPALTRPPDPDVNLRAVATVVDYARRTGLDPGETLRICDILGLDTGQNCNRITGHHPSGRQPRQPNDRQDR